MADEVKVFYLRDKKKFPVACVASKRNGDGIDFAVSAYNPRDTFNKQLGKQIALGRLEAGHIVGRVQAEPKQVKKAILESLMKAPLSQTVREASQLWLENTSHL